MVAQKLFSLAALFIWMFVIFVLSHQTGLGVRGEPTVWFYLERKGAHVFEYFVLAALLFQTLRAFFPNERQKFILAFVAVFSLFYAVSDELHQTFVFGREGKFSDVLIDAIGMVLFVIGHFFRSRSRKTK